MTFDVFYGNGSNDLNLNNNINLNSTKNYNIDYGVSKYNARNTNEISRFNVRNDFDFNCVDCLNYPPMIG